MKHLRCLLIIFSLMLGGASTGMAQDFDKGVAAWGKKKWATALREFVPLAQQGDAKAQYALGQMLRNGQGVPQDDVEAVRWYRLAAAQGHAKAQYALGFMYDTGQGVPQDYAEAMKWYRLAAENGYAMAQHYLGFMYDTGIGVLQDDVMALMWYNIASANGVSDAGGYRDKRASLMTSADISKAQALARECMSSSYRNCGW